MNYELEFENLGEIQQLLNEDKPFDACSRLLALGVTLIQKADEKPMKPVMLLGQYSKVSKQLMKLYEALMAEFSLNDELKKYEERLQDMNDELNKIQSEYIKLSSVNDELLSQEKELRETKEKLENLVVKSAELKNMKETEIKELESQQGLLEEKLEKLDEETKKARDSLERYKAELSEDGRLIRELPEQYGTTKSVDQLIAELKSQEIEAQNLHKAYEQGLTNLIEQISISYEILKGNGYE